MAVNRRPRNGRIHREGDPARSRELMRVLICAALLAIPIFFYIWEQVTLYQIGQEIQTMERQRSKLQEEGRALDLRQAELSSLARVERIAQHELHFVEGNPVVILLPDGKVASAGMMAQLNKESGP